MSSVAGHPDVERGQQEDADDQVGQQAADDDDGEGPLRVGADGVRERGGQQAQRGHQHGHHDGPQAQNGALDGGLDDVLVCWTLPFPCGGRATG